MAASQCHIYGNFLFEIIQNSDSNSYLKKVAVRLLNSKRVADQRARGDNLKTKEDILT